MLSYFLLACVRDEEHFSDSKRHFLPIDVASLCKLFFRGASQFEMLSYFPLACVRDEEHFWTVNDISYLSMLLAYINFFFLLNFSFYLVRYYANFLLATTDEWRIFR